MSRSKIQKLALATAATLGAASLAACGGTSAVSGSDATAASSAVVPLTLYAAEGYDSSVPKAFTVATGIPVTVDDDSTGPLLTKISAEGANGKWSMLWVDGDTAFAALDKQGLLAPYTPKANYTAAGQRLVPADHSYVPTGTTAMAAVIYNAAKVTAVPKTYQDLEGAAYAGKVGMNDPSQSGPTFPFIAGIMNQLGGQANGVAAGEAFFSKLKANGLHVFPTNGDTLHALETGQIDYGLIQSSAAAGEVLKTKATASFKPAVTYLPLSTLLPSVIGIDKADSPQVRKEAQEFIDFIFTAKGQAAMQAGDPQGDSLYWPIVTGTNPLPGAGALPVQIQHIDPAFWGPQENQINSWFDANIK